MSNAVTSNYEAAQHAPQAPADAAILEVSSVAKKISPELYEKIVTLGKILAANNVATEDSRVLGNELFYSAVAKNLTKYASSGKVNDLIDVSPKTLQKDDSGQDIKFSQVKLNLPGVEGEAHRPKNFEKNFKKGASLLKESSEELAKTINQVVKNEIEKGSYEKNDPEMEKLQSAAASFEVLARRMGKIQDRNLEQIEREISKSNAIDEHNEKKERSLAEDLHTAFGMIRKVQNAMWDAVSWIMPPIYDQHEQKRREKNAQGKKKEVTPELKKEVSGLLGVFGVKADNREISSHNILVGKQTEHEALSHAKSAAS